MASSVPVTLPIRFFTGWPVRTMFPADHDAVADEGSTARACDALPGEGPAKVFVIGPLIVDVLGGAAARDGRALRLLPKQFALLAYLAKHANQIVGREEIARNVWCDDTATWTNVIAVAVNGLRKELERDGLPALLHTVRGQGYCLGVSPRCGSSRKSRNRMTDCNGIETRPPTDSGPTAGAGP